MQELDASFHYDDCTYVDKAAEQYELVETFNAGIDNLRTAFEDGVKRLNSVFD